MLDENVRSFFHLNSEKVTCHFFLDASQNRMYACSPRLSKQMWYQAEQERGKQTLKFNIQICSIVEACIFQKLQMESHMKDTCTHRSMKCEYSDEGCTFIVRISRLFLYTKFYFFYGCRGMPMNQRSIITKSF